MRKLLVQKGKKEQNLKNKIGWKVKECWKVSLRTCGWKVREGKFWLLAYLVTGHWSKDGKQVSVDRSWVLIRSRVGSQRTKQKWMYTSEGASPGRRCSVSVGQRWRWWADPICRKDRTVWNGWMGKPCRCLKHGKNWAGLVSKVKMGESKHFLDECTSSGWLRQMRCWYVTLFSSRNSVHWHIVGHGTLLPHQPQGKSQPYNSIVLWRQLVCMSEDVGSLKESKA